MTDNELEIPEKNINQDDSDVEEAATKGLRSETLRIAILVFFSLTLLVFIAPYFLDNSALKFQLAQKLSQSLQTKLEIHGKVRVAFIPSPKIIVNDVVLKNYRPKFSEKSYDFYAKSVEVRFPIFNFSDDVSASKIIFVDAVAASYYSDEKAPPRQDDLAKIISDFAQNSTEDEKNLGSGMSAKLFSTDDLFSSISSKSGLPRVVVKNGRMISYDKFLRKKETTSIDVTAEISEQKIAADGKFSNQNIASGFKLVAIFNSKSGEQDSLFDLVSPVLELHIKGNFISANKGLLKSDFSGKMDAEIMELKSFYQSYIDSNGVISAKLKYNSKPIKISAEIDSATQEISVNNLKIASDLVNGGGRAYFNLANKNSVADITLDLDNLDLDGIWSSELVTIATGTMGGNVPKIPDNGSDDEVFPVQSSEDLLEKNNTLNIDLNLIKKIKDLDLTTEISVKKIKYLAGEILDADLYFSTSADGDIMVMPAIFKIPGEGVVRLSGVFDNSTLTSKFIGKLDAHGKSLKEILRWLKIESQNLKLDALNEYDTYSDVMILPNSVTLNNFYLNLNENKSEFSGEMKLENDGKAINSSGRFHVNSLNVDDHFLISGQNTYFSPGLLLKKLFWLNDVSSSNAFDLSFDKLIYKKEEFGEQSFKFMIRRGYIEIADLNLQSPKTDFKANFSVDISEQNPRLMIKIDAKKFHYETPESEKNSDKKINSFDQFFGLPSLEGFAGEVNANLTEAQIDGVQINYAKLFGKLKDGNIDEATFSGEFYGGKFSYSGVLGLKINKTINGNILFENASLNPLLFDLFGINSITGVGNFAANITAVANSKSEFLKQLKSELKFSANVPSIEGYGLSDLVKKMFAPQTYRQELLTPEKILFNPEGKTIFKQASGTIQINGGKDGKVRINISAPAMNGILSGTFSAEDRVIDLLFNAIFLTGDATKQTPINIATNLRGKTDNILQSTNIDQIRQYLGLSTMKKSIIVATP